MRHIRQAPPEVPEYYVPIYGAHIQDHKRANFAGMLGAMDEGVGNVTAALASKKMMENIIILFTADNGGPTTTGDAVGSRNWPLKGGKHSIWEGGTRATACIWSPNLLGINTHPTKYILYKNLAHASDWLPTLVLAAGPRPFCRTRHCAHATRTQWAARPNHCAAHCRWHDGRQSATGRV